MKGQEIIDYILRNKLESSKVYGLQFDVRLKDGSRLGYEVNDFTEDGSRLIKKIPLSSALKLRGETSPFRCKAEESKWQDAAACKDCQNKCEEYNQWDKEMKK